MRPRTRPAIGDLWKHRTTHRHAIVHYVSGLPFCTVEYRYLAPTHSKGNGHMRPRTTTTAVRIGTFLRAFTLIVPGPTPIGSPSHARLRR